MRAALALGRCLSTGAVMGALISGITPARAFDAAKVNAFCLAGFNTAMNAAGKTPPAGMDVFTCNCFSQRLQQGQSIDQARIACRDAAAAKFPLQ